MLPQRIADDDGPVADANLRDIPHLDGRQMNVLHHAQNGQIRQLVIADDLRFQIPSLTEHLHVVCAFNHVVIGHHMPLRRHHNAGARRLLNQFRLPANHIERIRPVAHADNAGHHRLHNVRKRAFRSFQRLNIFSLRVNAFGRLRVRAGNRHNFNRQHKPQRRERHFSEHFPLIHPAHLAGSFPEFLFFHAQTRVSFRLFG